MAARGEQPTPFLCSRFAFCPFAHLPCGFAACSNLHTKVGVDNLPASRRPRSTRPRRMGGPSILSSVRLYCSVALAACKTLARSSSEFVCRKHSHWCPLPRAVPLRRVTLTRCAGLLQSRTSTPSSRLLQSALQQHSLARAVVDQQPWQELHYASSSCRAGPSSACSASRKP